MRFPADELPAPPPPPPPPPLSLSILSCAATTTNVNIVPAALFLFVGCLATGQTFTASCTNVDSESPEATGHRMALVGTSVYVFGGRSLQSNLASFDVSDVGNITWQDNTPLYKSCDAAKEPVVVVPPSQLGLDMLHLVNSRAATDLEITVAGGESVRGGDLPLLLRRL